MSSSTSRAIASALLLLTLALSISAQSPVLNKNVKPAGSISGRVTVKGKGLAGIGIALRRPNQTSPFETLPRAITDEDGNYKIANVSAGTYEVQTNISAYVTPENPTGGRGRPVIVAEGENIDNIDFSMARGGVITGKITDVDGRPVIQQQVRLFRAENPESRPPQQPQPANFPANNTTTDDRGIYRMFGLMPGRYKVASGRSNETFPTFNQPGCVNYKEVFYPDANEPAKGAVLEVTEGSENTNIDIVLGRPIETFTAAGRIIDGEKGEPVPNLKYGIQRIDGATGRSEFVGANMATNTGEFVVGGLIPGQYSVFMSDPNNEFRMDGTTFDITDSDVSGITVRLVRGGSISGVVVLDTEDKQVLSRLSRLVLSAFVEKPQNMGVDTSAPSSRSTINPDGSFRIAGLAGGTAFLSLSWQMDRSVMEGLTISRVEREGVAQPLSIEIKEGEQVTGVRVIVSYGNSMLRGTVKFENGPLPAGARILVRLAKLGDTAYVVRPITVDARGRFAAEGLTAGTYELIVQVFGGGLKPQLPLKQQVIIQNGVTTELTIPFTLADGPRP